MEQIPVVGLVVSGGKIAWEAGKVAKLLQQKNADKTVVRCKMKRSAGKVAIEVVLLLAGVGVSALTAGAAIPIVVAASAGMAAGSSNSHSNTRRPGKSYRTTVQAVDTPNSRQTTATPPMSISVLPTYRGRTEDERCAHRPPLSPVAAQNTARIGLRNTAASTKTAADQGVSLDRILVRK